MIKSKDDLRLFLAADKYALNRIANKPGKLDFIWKFEILLRYSEYYYNKIFDENGKKRKEGGGKYLFNLLMFKFYLYRKEYLGLKCGFSIPLNVCDMGLSIAHLGTIVISNYAKIGKNVRIHACVNIGTQYGYEDMCPTIGNHVFIGPGAKLFGDIKIPDYSVIGANAVVNKTFEDENTCIAGIPAKIINKNGRKRTEALKKHAQKFDKLFNNEF